MASFSGVAIVKEVEAIIRHFCKQYIRAEAQQISIYFDGSVDHITKDGVLAEGGAVTLIACTDTFWQSRLGERPRRLRDRQVAIYQMAYRA